ncbi:MAG: SagB/ThcOx family dehydrogenase [Nanoarchaeota archaeon]|nr:SagB/ThcOx family dehydrogenase [Nanoarchaeota archaeon]
MLDEIKNFYERIKLKGVEDDVDDGEAPITFIHVFKKAYPRLPSIILPRIDSKSELEKILESRESTREFSNEPINLEELSKILKSCRIVDEKREPEKRTYPSAGARFPIEFYVISYNVDGLNKGAYHYNMDRSVLEVLWQKDLDYRQPEITGTNIKNPAATIVLTSVISRSEVKYWYKALPLSYLEAGHIGQNIVLSAAENNIGACPVSGFVDDTLIEILDLTEGEIPVYTISLGKRKGL